VRSRIWLVTSAGRALSCATPVISNVPSRRLNRVRETVVT
jgi:hypothetical protein